MQVRSSLGFDHLVYGVTNLDVAMQEIADATGVVPSPGGKHLNFGVHNAIVPLGPRRYLEIVAVDPDPEREPTEEPPFGLAHLRSQSFIGWAFASDDLPMLKQMATEQGLETGEIRTMSRTRPDGRAITWERMRVEQANIPTLVPFFLDWKDSPHPADSSTNSLQLRELVIGDPQPAVLRRRLQILGIMTPVVFSAVPVMSGTFEGPRGNITLGLRGESETNSTTREQSQDAT